MSIDPIPIWVIFAATIAVVMADHRSRVSAGACAHRRSEDEKESPVSAIAGSVLGLAAFMLAFTFGIVSERFDAKSLVREEAAPSAPPGSAGFSAGARPRRGLPPCCGNTSTRA